MFKKLIEQCQSKSPWLFHLNSGACNGCDIEIIASLTPLYDVERFGILEKGSPRHADIIVVSGPVTRHSSSRLKRVFDQTPDPKVVVAIGSCPTTGGIFKDSHTILPGLDNIVPVDCYVPGCAPKPEAIIMGTVKALEKLKEKREKMNESSNSDEVKEE